MTTEPSSAAWSQAPATGRRAPTATGPVWPVTVGLLIASSVVLAVLRPSSLAFVGPLVAVPVVVLLERARPGAVSRLLAVVGSTAGGVVSTVLFTLLGLVLVAIPWAAAAPFGLDPLAGPRSWSERRRRDIRPGALWSPVSEVTPVRPRRRARALRAVAVLVVVAGIVAVIPPARSRVVALFDRNRFARAAFTLSHRVGVRVGLADLDYPAPDDLVASTPDPNGRFASLAHSPWFYGGEYSAAQGWAFEPDVAWRPINGYRMLDFTSRYVNVLDGRRVSWTPPPCDCRRLTVWVYGGSTTWGLDQRDGHTIPSELARVAHAAGITVDVQNRGGLGQLHWIEAERFAWDLTVEPPPDMVLFYDGVNDAWAANSNDPVSERDMPLIDPTLKDLWGSTGRSDGPPPDGPPGSKSYGPATDGLYADDRADATIDRYQNARRLSRTTAERHGIVARWVWQPSRFDRPFEPSEPHADTAVENASRYDRQLLRERLPKDVIDVSRSLAKVKGALYSDDVHHNERGARLIATAIFQRIEPDLLALRSKKEAAK